MRKLILFLLLGAAANVAVAWGIASLAPLPLRLLHLSYSDGLRWPCNPPAAFPSKPTHLAYRGGTGFEREELEAYRRTAEDIRVELFMIKHQRQAIEKNEKLAAFRADLLAQQDELQQLYSHAEEGDDLDYGITSIRTGWPCLAFIGFRWREGSSLSSQQNEGRTAAMEIQVNPLRYSFTGFSTQEPRLIPLRIRPTGFIVNSLFYAATCWLLFTMPLLLRRRRRIKRGLCPACAYPMGVSDKCTECGNALKRKSQARCDVDPSPHRAVYPPPGPLPAREGEH